MQMHLRRFSVGVGALAAAVSSADAQSTSLPPIRKLGPIVAQTKTDIPGIQAVRALGDGRVLVNGARGRQLLLFDPSLGNAKALVSTPTANGMERSALLPARGDSSLFIDGQTKIDVLDPAGNVVRSMSLPPRENSGTDLLATGDRLAGDRQGRVLFIPPPPFFLSLVDGFVGDTILAGPQSVPLLRFDPATQRTDTVATLAAPRRRQAITRWANGGRGTVAEDPFPLIGDDWSTLSDGTIAIARLNGYSLDLIAPTGTKTVGARLPHEWTAIPAAKKTAIMDSVRLVRNAARADSMFPADSARYDSLALVAKANPEALTDANGKRIGLGPRPVRLQFVSPADLPDSIPAFAPGSVVVDADDNVWIQNYFPARPGGGFVYDVVNKKGVLIDRVEVPAGCTLVAFVPGFALLRVNDGRSVAIAKARLR